MNNVHVLFLYSVIIKCTKQSKRTNWSPCRWYALHKLQIQMAINHIFTWTLFFIRRIDLGKKKNRQYKMNDQRQINSSCEKKCHQMERNSASGNVFLKYQKGKHAGVVLKRHHQLKFDSIMVISWDLLTGESVGSYYVMVIFVLIFWFTVVKTLI